MKGLPTLTETTEHQLGFNTVWKIDMPTLLHGYYFSKDMVCGREIKKNRKNQTPPICPTPSNPTGFGIPNFTIILKQQNTAQIHSKERQARVLVTLSIWSYLYFHCFNCGAQLNKRIHYRSPRKRCVPNLARATYIEKWGEGGRGKRQLQLRKKKEKEESKRNINESKSTQSSNYLSQMHRYVPFQISI